MHEVVAGQQTLAAQVLTQSARWKMMKNWCRLVKKDKKAAGGDDIKRVLGQMKQDWRGEHMPRLNYTTRNERLQASLMSSEDFVKGVRGNPKRRQVFRDRGSA